MESLEKQLKALANRRRLSIIKFLKKSRKASVGDIAKEIKLSFRSTSRHLAILRTADIVESQQVNLHMYYSLTVPGSPLTKFISNLI